MRVVEIGAGISVAIRQSKAAMIGLGQGVRFTTEGVSARLRLRLRPVGDAE